MRFRLAAVLLLATLSIAVRLTSIELRYLSTELSSAPPFGTRVAGRYLIVDRVQPAADCYRGWSDPGRPKPGDRVQAVYDHRGGGGLKPFGRGVPRTS